MGSRTAVNRDRMLVAVGVRVVSTDSIRGLHVD